MELRHLRHFVAVAEDLHFGRAAARLGIEQSPLSRSIRHLEERLSCTLLCRAPHGNYLTAAGAALLPNARAILALVTRLKMQARTLNEDYTHSIQIGVCDAIANPRLSLRLSLLRQRNPQLAIEIQSLTGDTAVSAIEQGQVDATFTLGHHASRTLLATMLWNERLDVVMATKHRLAADPSVPLSILVAASEILVAPSWAAIVEVWLRDVAGQQTSPRLRVLPTISGLLTAVGLDLGIAIVPFGIATSFAREDITVRRIAGRQRRVPAVMLSRRDATHPAIAILREIARERSIPHVRRLTADSAAPAETPDRSP
jgi:DNA-binding transcriptional LysR family regulator